MNIKNSYLIIISVIFIIVSIALKIYSSNIVNNINDNYTLFNNVNSENEKSYIYPTYVTKIADYYYLVYSNDTECILKSKIELDKTEFDGKYNRVLGSSKSFSDEDKQIILNATNDKDESEESIIEYYEFNDAFGNYYLEVSKVMDDSKTGSVASELGSLFLEGGIVCLVLIAIKIIIDRKKQIY